MGELHSAALGGVVGRKMHVHEIELRANGPFDTCT